MSIRTLILIVLLSLPTLAHAQEAPPAALGRHDAVELRVESWRLANRYGPVKASEKSQFLILQTTWRNVIQNDQVVPYMVPELTKQLFLIAGGARVTPYADEVRGRPGIIRTNSFTISGQPVSGTLVFELPEGDPGDLLLVMIDENNGVIRIPLKGKDIPPADDKPKQLNQLIDAFVLGTRELDEKTVAGTKLLAVDIRWASRVKEAKAKTGKLVNIPDWKQTFQLVVDGETVAPTVRAPMEQVLSILPDVCTGGELVFRVPADYTTARLDLHFSQAQLPGVNKPIRPKTLSFDIKPGDAPAPAEAKHAWEDQYFQIRLLGTSQAKIRDYDMSIVRLRVTNRAKSWEVLQPYAQFRARAADKDIGCDATGSRELPRGIGDTLLIPPGQTRQFDLAYYGDITQLLYLSAQPDGGATIELKPGGTVAAAPQKRAIDRSRQPEDDAPAPAPPAEKVLKPADYPQLPDPASLKAKGLAGVGLKPEQVNTAIDRGADALWSLRRDNFVDPRNVQNVDLLAALAMTYSGLHKRNAEFDTAINKLIDSYRPHGNAIYEAGIMLMMIEAYGSPNHLPLARELAQGIVDSQCADGSFSYIYKGKHVERAKPVVVTNGAIQVTAGDEPKEVVPTSPLKRSLDKPLDKGGDNSTTQYAVLGLASAQRMGIAIDPTVWKAALDVTAKRQSDIDGGWAYHDADTSYGSMTAAGFSSLSIARHFAGQQPDPKSANKAMRWINAYFTVSRHPRSNDQWLYYYLYGVERLGRVLDTEFFGSHEWYPTGARFLIDSQGRDGAWRGKGGSETYPEYATSFALLFLTKATPTLDAKKAQQQEGTLTVTAKTPAPKPAPPPPPAKKIEKPKIYFILDCSGSMLEEMGGKTKFDIARDAVKAMVESLPDNVEVGLRVYGHRKRAIEKDADKDVEEIVKLSALDRKSINAKLDALRSRGKTPLAESLSQTAKTLAGATADNPVTVILLTDGGEDTRPRGDPVAAAGELAKIAGVQLKIVGFDINQEDWTKQLTEMASAGKGTFVSAADAAKLTAGVVAAADEALHPKPVEAPAPPPEPKPETFTITNEKGETVASGAFGQTVKLKPGKYTFATKFDGKDHAQTFFMAAGRSTTLHFAP